MGCAAEKNESFEMLTCPLCSFLFEKKEAACVGCAFMGKCSLLKCPNCSYEFTEESKLVKWFQKKLKRRDGEK